MRLEPLLFIGTYSQRGSAGIYICRLDFATGALTPIGTAECDNPSFLTLSPNGRFLYAVNEVGEFAGQPGSAVTAFALDIKTGALQRLNQQATPGRFPCHVQTDRTGRWLLTANYGDGTHSILPILEDGSLGPMAALLKNAGTPGPGQQGGHAHCTMFAPEGRFAYACDLGLDSVITYSFDPAAGTVREVATAHLPGAGPRHLAFHPTLSFLYVINELDSTIAVFSRDLPNGSLRFIQTLSTLPKGFTGDNACADIHLTPNGRYLYGSNRGHDSLAVFAVDQNNGTLTAAGHAPTGGQWPRNFAVLSDDLILVANERSDTIVAFRLGSDGLPIPTGAVTAIPAPTCLLPAAPK